MKLIVIGDIHTQADKLWMMLMQTGLADAEHNATQALHNPNTKLILLGDLIHAKSRERYSQLAKVRRYDEFNPHHLGKAEAAQQTFLSEVKRFYDSVPEGQVTILMGNHDYNAIRSEQGPLRTDDVSHLEWKQGYGGKLDEELHDWVEAWPYEISYEGIHFAHVGPLPEHNRYDHGFYLENRRRWITEDRNFFEDTDYRLGVYGHTPVRGGVNIASQGQAILLDTNGHMDEYAYLVIETNKDRYRLLMHGTFFDEYIAR